MSIELRSGDYEAASVGGHRSFWRQYLTSNVRGIEAAPRFVAQLNAELEKKIPKPIGRAIEGGPATSA